MNVRSLISNLSLGTILASMTTLAIVGLVIWLFPNDVDEQAKATYVVGFSAIILGVWQFRRTFTQKNKIKVFEEIKAEIEAAKNALDSINQGYQNLFQQLAQLANKASVPPQNTPSDAEVKSLLEDIKRIGNEHKNQIKSIHESYLKVLKLIQKIEKSTILREATRKAARYLFYVATDQHNLVTKANAVLLSFNTTPPLGERPNISPETFNGFSQLSGQINIRNNVISNYLDDLEVIVHNDLISNVFNKARPSTLPDEHLTTNGFIDKRVRDRLL